MIKNWLKRNQFRNLKNVFKLQNSINNLIAIVTNKLFCLLLVIDTHTCLIKYFV